MRNVLVLLLLLSLPVLGAERKFDFAGFPQNQTPPGFRSTVTGKGKPGEWKIIAEEVPPTLAPLSDKAPVVTKQAVLAQLARDTTDDHYPLLIYEDEVFGDFTLKARFKIVSGTAEQMAGVAFRIQDEKNYYYVRASALGNTFYFFKFVNGELIGPIGSKVEISTNTWHELAVKCAGSEVTCSLDGKVIIPQMRQDTFPKGRIGFWTKSDSVSYFMDTRLEYRPLEPVAQALVREMLRTYPRLLGLKICVAGPEPGRTRVIASKDETQIGQAGEKAEQEVLRQGAIFYGKGKESVVVTMPLRDRNGEVIAAARVIMKTFPGQTEQNAIVRATPIVKRMQGRISTLKELTE